MRKLCSIVMAIAVSLLLFTAMPIEKVHASTVKLNKTSILLSVNKTYRLKVKGTSKKIHWTSSNRSIAAVSKHGKVRAKKRGIVKVTAKAGKKKLKCKVYVGKTIYSSSRLTLSYIRTSSGGVRFAVKNKWDRHMEFSINALGLDGININGYGTTSIKNGATSGIYFDANSNLNYTKHKVISLYGYSYDINDNHWKGFSVVNKTIGTTANNEINPLNPILLYDGKYCTLHYVGNSKYGIQLLVTNKKNHDVDASMGKVKLNGTTYPEDDDYGITLAPKCKGYYTYRCNLGSPLSSIIGVFDFDYTDYIINKTF